MFQQGDMIMTLSNLIFRNVTSFASIFMLSVVFLSGCGGDGDGEVADVPATVPDQLSYEIKQAENIELVIDQAGDTVTISSAFLTGSYNRITEAFTLEPIGPAMSVSAPAFLDGLLSTEFNSYVLQVKEALAWVGDGSPTSGEFELRDDQVLQRLIRVSVSQAGVVINYFEDVETGNSVSKNYTWDQFDELFENTSEEDYFRIAAFGYNVLHFMYEQSEIVITALELISENDIQLEETGTVEQNCDTYPLPPLPAVSYDPGLIKVNWYDADNSISIGPGDTVYLGFIECWDNDETDTIDTFFDGTVNMVNYTEVENAGVVTRIGFEPSASGTGGIQYDYLDITETETTGSNVVFVTSETLTLSGGFSMVFTSP
jgi:hypothetical protein